MRNLFLVGAKLLGIFYCFWALSILPQIIAGFRALNSTSQGDQAAGMWGFIISLLFAMLLNILLGIILIFSTNKVATKLNIPDIPLQSETIFPQYIRIGIVLIGIYTLTLGIPETIKSLVQMKMLGMLRFNFASEHFLSGVAKVAIGSWFAFAPSRIVQLISKSETNKT
jgi:hypothetical protein